MQSGKNTKDFLERRFASLRSLLSWCPRRREELKKGVGQTIRELGHLDETRWVTIETFARGARCPGIGRQDR
jgi:hypothetical protein